MYNTYKNKTKGNSSKEIWMGGKKYYLGKYI